MPLLDFAKEEGAAPGEVRRGSRWDLRVASEGVTDIAQSVGRELVARIGEVSHETYGTVATIAHELASEHPPLANPHLFVADAVGQVAVMVKETYGGAK